MNRKFIVTTVIVFIVGGTAGFFGGMKYAQSKNAQGRNAFVAGLQNLSPEERQQRLNQLQADGGRRGALGQGGGGFTRGEIIKKDENSITVKLPDGGSKIVIFSSSTGVGKTTEGTTSDLEVGNQVVVNGSANSDGSISAEIIQIQPMITGRNN